MRKRLLESETELDTDKELGDTGRNPFSTLPEVYSCFASR
jgi:hypothetical protein